MADENRKCILIIDDDAALTKILKTNLEAAQYGVFAAATGEDGLKILGRESIDLVILDIILPKMSGIEVFKNILKLETNIPVLVLTARSELEDFFENMDAAGFISKPVDVKITLREVKRITENKRIPTVMIMDGLHKPHVKDIKALIKKDGFRVVIVQDVEAFKTELARTRPAIILMEFENRSMPGDELIKKVKNISSLMSKEKASTLYNSHLLVYTNSANNYKEKSLDAGADQYFGKPQNYDELTSEVRRWVEKARENEEIELLKKQHGGAGGGPKISDFKSVGF